MMVSADAAGLRLTLATVAAKDRNEVDAGHHAPLHRRDAVADWRHGDRVVY